MGKLIDMTGKKFGRWTVIERSDNSKRGNAQWICKCDCGTTSIVRGDLMRIGHSTSCGCIATEKLVRYSTKHGDTRDSGWAREYKVWSHIKQRCLNPKDSHYKYYGGRGICICDRWLNSYVNFLVDMGRCPKSLTIERIDNDGNYEPGNCKWATQKEQVRNRSNNVWIEFDNKRMIQTDWLRELGVTWGKWNYWLKQGFSEGALITRFSMKALEGI